MRDWEPEGKRKEGTPQGGVVTPLLANLYLNPLDWLMSQAGMEMVRYADDMVILCREAEKEPSQALAEGCEDWMDQVRGWNCIL